MLQRALDLLEASNFILIERSCLLSIHQDVIYFIRMLGLQEWDPEKCRKITDLELSDDEWQCVHLLLSLLGVQYHSHIHIVLDC